MEELYWKGALFAPLHVKSEYSLGLGSAPVEALARAAAERGYPALALTDVETLAGQVRFHHAARAHGVRPITGVELRAGYGPGALGRDEGRLVLLARDRSGYESLCRLVTRRRAPGGLTPEPLRCLEDRPEGVWYASDDPIVIDRLLAAGVAVDQIRFLLAPSGPSEPPAGIVALADPDVLLAEPAEQELQRLLAAIRTGRRVDDSSETEAGEARVSPARMLERYPGEALAETVALAERCRLDLSTPVRALPTIGVPPGVDAADHLEAQARSRLEGWRLAGRRMDARYDERLAREMAVVRALDLAPFFVLVETIVSHARATGVETAGRGSAAGSLLLHLLGVTSLDPIAHGLLFERFLHAERSAPPDVDLDLPSHRRDEVIDWSIRRFGTGRAARVAAYSTFRRRSAYREGLKAYGAAPSVVERVARLLPPDEIEEPGAPAPALPLPPSLRSRGEVIERLVGRPRHLAAHPGGIVVAEPSIDRFAPLERAPGGALVTQYDMHSLAALGLMKIDLLGNRALTALAEAEHWIGAPIVAPDRDPRTATALRSADTVGCFQIETPTVRAALRRIPARGIDELTTVLAIVRPGPASGDAKAEFIRRVNGDSDAAAPHPRLTSALRGTHGMLLFDEDLIVAIAASTGWTLARADSFREAIVEAGEDPVAVAGLRDRYRAAALETGVARAGAEAIWSAIAPFAAYSFSKAHAASYAEIAWRCCFAKTHHAAAYGCGLLNSYGGCYPLRTVAADLVRSGVQLLAPDVNRSEEPCVLEEGAIRIGLASIKHVTKRTRAALRSNRPFRDWAELRARVSLSARESEALALSGACDSLAPLAPLASEPTGSRAAVYRALVRIQNELRFLGMHPSGHPMAILREEATRFGCLPVERLPTEGTGPVRVAGVVAATRRLNAGRGRALQLVTLEDETGLLETVVPAALTLPHDPSREPGPFMVEGSLRREYEDVRLIASAIEPFHDRERPWQRERPERGS